MQQAQPSAPNYGARECAKTDSRSLQATSVERVAIPRHSDTDAGSDRFESQLRTLRAHVSAQGIVLQALLATHPQRHLVKQEFKARSLQQLTGTLPARGMEAIEAFDLARNHWLTLLEGS